MKDVKKARVTTTTMPETIATSLDQNGCQTRGSARDGVSAVLSETERPHTYHQLRTLLILVFDATVVSRRSPYFHGSLMLGSAVCSCPCPD